MFLFDLFQNQLFLLNFFLFPIKVNSAFRWLYFTVIDGERSLSLISLDFYFPSPYEKEHFTEIILDFSSLFSLEIYTFSSMLFYIFTLKFLLRYFKDRSTFVVDIISSAYLIIITKYLFHFYHWFLYN